jgi:hypothetical protein
MDAYTAMPVLLMNTWDFSGLDFETRIMVKPDAPELEEAFIE